jgi:hypothetical protein
MQFLSQVSKSRTDLLPHYSRLVATLNPYMPDVGTELVSVVCACKLVALWCDRLNLVVA